MSYGLNIKNRKGECTDGNNINLRFLKSFTTTYEAGSITIEGFNKSNCIVLLNVPPPSYDYLSYNLSPWLERPLSYNGSTISWEEAVGNEIQMQSVIIFYKV